MESVNLKNGILAEELVSVALLEDGFNVARPVRIGPIDFLSIWDGKVIKRFQSRGIAMRGTWLKYERPASTHIEELARRRTCWSAHPS